MSYDYQTYWKTCDWSPDPADQWFDTIKSHLLGKTILDIGCGEGRFRPLFGDMQYTGIDISPLSIAEAQAKYPNDTWKEMDIVVDKPMDTFDVIFTWVTLQHIPPGHIASVASWMKTHGKRILMGECLDDGEIWSDHNFKHDYSKLFDIQGTIHIGGPVHLLLAKGSDHLFMNDYD